MNQAKEAYSGSWWSSVGSATCNPCWHLFAAGRRLASTTEETVTCLTKSKVESMLMYEKEQEVTSMISLGLKPLYPTENCIETLSNRIWEHILAVWIFAWESSQNLIDHIRGTWTSSLDPFMTWSTLSPCSILSFSTMKLLSLAELGKTRQYLGKDLDVFIKRFNKKALDCYDLVAEDVWGGLPPQHDRKLLSISQNISFSFILGAHERCKVNKCIY